MPYDRGEYRGEPAVEFRWDSLVLAHHDKTFSTTIRIQVSGWWSEERPRQVALSVYERGQEPPAGDAVRIQKGHGIFPLTGLKPGHHYHVVVYIEDRTPVQNVIYVPELPKLKKQPTRQEKEIASTKTQIELVEVEKELKEVEKGPDPEEQELKSLQSRFEREKVQREIRQVVLPEGKRKIKIVRTVKGTGGLQVVLQRIGKDGVPEAGTISSYEVGNGGVRFDRPDVSVDNLGIVVFSLPYLDHPRFVTFILSDDIGVQVTVDVSARNETTDSGNNKTEAKSASERISEAFQRGRRGQFQAAKDPAKVLPLAVVAGSILATVFASRGPEGQGGK